MFRELIILLILYNGPNHGYGIQRAANYVMTINNRTLYQTLRKFEENNYVTKEFVHQERKAGKYIYHLEGAGLQELKSRLKKFDMTQAASWLEFLVRIGHPELLEKEDIFRIIEMREQYLKSADRLNNVLSITEGRSYAKIINSHISGRVSNELAFIEEIKAGLSAEN